MFHESINIKKNNVQKHISNFVSDFNFFKCSIYFVVKTFQWVQNTVHWLNFNLRVYRAQLVVGTEEFHLLLLYVSFISCINRLLFRPYNFYNLFTTIFFRILPFIFAKFFFQNLSVRVIVTRDLHLLICKSVFV